MSRYENHFDMRRPTNEDTSNEEFEIAVNGPNLSDCDAVVGEALDLCWGRRECTGTSLGPQLWRS